MLKMHVRGDRSMREKKYVESPHELSMGKKEDSVV